jgi:hypothetical protein
MLGDEGVRFAEVVAETTIPKFKLGFNAVLD